MGIKTLLQRRSCLKPHRCRAGSSETLCAQSDVVGLFRDEDGLTTVGMAVSIFLSLALIFSAAQLYRVSSASAEIQEVADVAALAAENEVAEFMVAANTCDAVILSMTLLSAAIYGIGIVAACVPTASALSEKLIELATKISRARDTFADRAADGLNKLQKLLPFLSAANSARVAQANNTGAMDASYFALSVLVPSAGQTIGIASDSLAEVGESVEGEAGGIREKSAQAEELARQANDAKLEGFKNDCGNSPDKCMYERASHLAGLSGAANPYYSSVDAWSFQVALGRACGYFAERKSSELGYNDASSTEEKADSIIRRYYYEYAYDEVSNAYADSTGSDTCFMPSLFNNTEGLRGTSMYTDSKYPITVSDDKSTMHAWPGCPNASDYSSLGSVEDLENGEFETCGECLFVPSSVGNVAAATTNTLNGFEHYYKIVREACERYNDKMAELSPIKAEVEGTVDSLLGDLGDFLGNIESKRIHADPPGSAGAIAMVVNTAQNSADTGFESLFIQGGATLGTRAAVSGATLVEDASDSGSTVITSLLDGFGQDGGIAVGAAGIVLDCWSGLLRAFEDGQSALVDGVRNGLNAFSTNTSSGLGTWAADALSSMIGSVGLEPVSLNSLKPCIVNTAHIASADSGQFSVTFKNTKQQALYASTSATDPFSAAVASAESAIDNLGLNDPTITIATVEFPVGGFTVPVTITLPESISTAATGFVDDCIANVKGAISSMLGERSWQ